MYTYIEDFHKMHCMMTVFSLDLGCYTTKSFLYLYLLLWHIQYAFSLSCLSIFNSSFTFQVINSNIANDKWAIYYRGWGNCCLSKEETKTVHFTFSSCRLYSLDNVWPEDQVLLTMHWMHWIGWKESSGHLSKPCMTHYFPFIRPSRFCLIYCSISSECTLG